MKKLLTMAAVAMSAVALNAASVSWTLSGITASPDNAASAGWVAYFMDGSTYSAFSALAADKVADYAAANYTYTAKTTSGRTGVTVTQTTGSYASGDSVSAYIVLFDAATASEAGYYAATSVLETQVPAAGSTFAMSFPFATTTSGWQTTAVPEPTSGLLMLLGMAGLALRRRRT